MKLNGKSVSANNINNSMLHNSSTSVGNNNMFSSSKTNTVKKQEKRKSNVDKAHKIEEFIKLVDEMSEKSENKNVINSKQSATLAKIIMGIIILPIILEILGTFIKLVFAIIGTAV